MMHGTMKIKFIETCSFRCKSGKNNRQFTGIQKFMTLRRDLSLELRHIEFSMRYEHRLNKHTTVWRDRLPINPFKKQGEEIRLTDLWVIWRNSRLESAHLVQIWLLIIHSFIHSIATCRMRRFLAVLRSFFHSSPLCTFFLPHFFTNYSSIFSHLILQSISWATFHSCCPQIHI